MLGKRSAQRGLYEADTRYGEFVGQRTFYGYLASRRHELFQDEDFAALYSRHRGRPSLPPSLLAKALVLQTYDGVSDEEAKQAGCSRARQMTATARHDRMGGVDLDIRAARCARGLSQKQLAEMIGVSASEMSRWEHGKQAVPERRLWDLARVLRWTGTSRGREERSSGQPEYAPAEWGASLEERRLARACRSSNLLMML